MKKILAVILFLLGLGTAWWLTQGKPAPVQNHADSTRQAEKAPAEQSRPDLSKLPPPQQGQQEIDPQLRALLLAAIAGQVAQAQAAPKEDAGVQEDATTPSKADKPISQRRKVVQFQRETRKLLSPIVRDCLQKTATSEPQALGPDKHVMMQVEGGTDLGSLITQVQVNGAKGNIDAPMLQSCVQERAFSLRLPSPPIKEGQRKFNGKFSFTLIRPSGTQ